MPGPTSNAQVCHVCGATLTLEVEFCRTCHTLDHWMLAKETSNLSSICESIKEDDLLRVIQYIQRMRDRLRHPKVKNKKRKTPQEFDFALQELEKTTRGLELTSIEAVGVLEMVKQSFVEEMFYEDFRDDDTEDEDSDDES